MKTVRFLAPALLILALVFCFAACGSKSSAPAKTTPKTEAATTPGSSEQIATDSGSQTPPKTDVPATGTPATEAKTGEATPTVEITFNANGGRFADGKTTLTVNAKPNAALTAPASPTLDGFVFVGWSLDVGSTDVWLFDTDTVSASVTLYAKWEQRTVERNVTFKLNYPSAADVIAPTTNGLITYIPTRTDYAFNGWWISAGQLSNGEQILVQKWDMNTVVTDDDLVLYADWVEASAVSAQLSAPGVSINNTVFFWDAIEGAVGYDVRVYKAGLTVEEMSETVTGNTWTFPDGYEAGYYTVKIRAKGNGMNNFNSSYTSRNYANRVLPNISDVDFNFTTSVLTWASVANASAYELYIGGNPVSTSSYTTYDLSDYEAGDYQITIKATREGFTPSSVTKQITKRKLKTPGVSVNCHVEEETLLYTLTWEQIAKANVYKIDFGGTVIDVTDGLSYSFDNSAPFWDGDTVSFTVSAFDENADFMMSNPSESITVKKGYAVIVKSDIAEAGTSCFYTNDSESGVSYPNYAILEKGAACTMEVVPNLGYIWLGWYQGDTLVSKEKSFDWTITDSSVVLTAKFEVDPQMADFSFESTPTACIIKKAKNIKWLVIPEYVTAIENEAFSGCSKLTSVVWSATNCTSAGSSGSPIFSGCSNLTSVTFGKNVQTIPAYAFYGCSRLTKITIPDSVTSIGDYAFYGCSGLTAVYYTGDIAGWCGITFGSWDSNPLYYAHNLYLNGTLLTELVIPDTVSAIKNNAFYNCSGLTSVIIPDSVTSIGRWAFNGCSGLTEITIPDSVTSIGGGAFCECSKLTSVTIGNGVTSIESSAFSGCSALTSVTIGNGVTSIGNSAFRYCSGLTSVTILDSVTSIGNSAFWGCTRLTSITFTGTKAQWNAISKGYSWNVGTGSYTVHCTNGDIAK